MKTTDQIVAEAAKKCLKWVEGDDPFPPEAYGKCERIIQSAIIKGYEQGYANGWEACDNEAKISAAHASEQPEADFIKANHHPSCMLNDQDLMWVCAQCGLQVPAHANEIPETLPCPSCGARDHDLEIKVGILKSHAREKVAERAILDRIEELIEAYNDTDTRPSVAVLSDIDAALSHRQKI